jgi:hypothetical protein
MRLAQYATPTVSYELSAMDLSLLTGYKHEHGNWAIESPCMTGSLHQR